MPSEQSRIWTFTKQASTDAENVSWPLANAENPPLQNPDPEKIQGLFYQVERAPTTGQLHLQGFLVTKKKVAFSVVRGLFPGVHIERARGTQQQNKDYCSKSTSKVVGPFTIGELEAPGREKPFAECVRLVKEGNSIHSLTASFPEMVARHSRSLEALQRYLIPPPPAWRVLTVKWFYGRTGTGKTRQCYTECPDIYRVRDNGKWWDGYTNQDAILFDEFYGDIRCKDMLTWLDGYRISLPIKGGFVDAHWTKVYITSNVLPSEVYRSIPPDVFAAFMRRINVAQEFQ